jgi:20S proteasome alpha/beta subunit
MHRLVCELDGMGAVVLGADTRATGGPVIMDKRCAKIHAIADNIVCCGAGTSADAAQLCRYVRAELQRQRLLFSRGAYSTSRYAAPQSSIDTECCSAYRQRRVYSLVQFSRRIQHLRPR